MAISLIDEGVQLVDENSFPNGKWIRTRVSRYYGHHWEVTRLNENGGIIQRDGGLTSNERTAKRRARRAAKRMGRR